LPGTFLQHHLLSYLFWFDYVVKIKTLYDNSKQFKKYFQENFPPADGAGAMKSSGSFAT
jgi:hypothetical protein